MKKWKLLLTVAVGVGLGTLSGQSWAGCTVTGGPAKVEINIPDINVPPNATVGTLLQTIVVPGGPGRTVQCSNRIYDLFSYGTSRSLVSQPGVPAGVYSTGVNGIGVKVYNAPLQVYAKTGTTGTLYLTSGGTYTGAGDFGSQVQVMLYKTGDITAGELQFPDNFVEYWWDTSQSSVPSGGALVYILNVKNSPKVKIPTCETPNLTVKLGKHAKTDFGGVGSTSSETPFNFVLDNCDAGLNSVKFTFKPAAGITLKNSGTAAQHLSLKSGSTASGVGIQVLYQDGTLIPFNTANSIPLLSSGYIASTGGTFFVPMKARYIQTASTIQGGTANSAVEFTMTYE